MLRSYWFVLLPVAHGGISLWEWQVFLSSRAKVGKKPTDSATADCSATTPLVNLQVTWIYYFIKTRNWRNVYYSASKKTKPSQRRAEAVFYFYVRNFALHFRSASVPASLSGMKKTHKTRLWAVNSFRNILRRNKGEIKLFRAWQELERIEFASPHTRKNCGFVSTRRQ